MKFNFGYDQLQSAPIILENFGYMDPRSLLLINKLITLAAKNMHKIRADVDFTFKTQLHYGSFKIQIVEPIFALQAVTCKAEK